MISVNAFAADPGMAGESPTKPEAGIFEAGAYVGLFLPSDNHEFISFPVAEHRGLSDRIFDVGLRFGYYPLAYLGAELDASLLPGTTVFNESVRLTMFRAHVVAQYPARITPFVLAGGGRSTISSSVNVLGDNADFDAHWGLGAKFFVTPSILVRAEGRHIIGPAFYPSGESGRTSHFALLAGASYVFGRPDPKPMMKVETEVCPDGVTRSVGTCPKTMEPKEEDPQPQFGAGATEDVGSSRVIDADNDGVADGMDKCPGEAETANGFKDDDGCPDEMPKEVVAFSGTIEGIGFRRLTAKIRKRSYRVLKRAVAVMNKYPNLRIEVGGHADGRGDKAFNKRLSQQRADAVRAYMIKKGIDGDRIVAKGYGEEDPIASNNTNPGRAKNRRIVFKILQ